MQRSLRILLQLCLAAALLWPAGLALAQETTPSGPVYVVQSGDTLSSIALRFGITVADLQAANNISDPNQIIRVGDQLIIPGLEGIQGVLTTQAVPFGETLHSLSLRYQVAEDTLIRLNTLPALRSCTLAARWSSPKGRRRLPPASAFHWRPVNRCSSWPSCTAAILTPWPLPTGCPAPGRPCPAMFCACLAFLMKAPARCLLPSRP